jgi:hypothetical protein
MIVLFHIDNELNRPSNSLSDLSDSQLVPQEVKPVLQQKS